MINYYTSVHTAKGFVNVIHSNLDHIKHTIVLDHPSYPLKTAIIKKIINYFETDYDLEVIHSTASKQFLDGVIIREKSLAIITNDIATDGFKQEVFHLEKFVPNQSEEDLTQLKQKMNTSIYEAYENFSKGLQGHDLLEKVYINEMDFHKANLLTERFIVDLLYQVPANNCEGGYVERFFGANTPDGSVNIVPKLLDRVSKRFFLKGRAGTGKSTFMRKVVKACEDHGVDVEIYRCSFDPESIDMVLAPDLNACIFDSTGPHEFFPEHGGDTVIDLYEETVTPGTDEKYAKEIKELTHKYKTFMREGREHLKQARIYQEKWESLYPFNDFDVDQLFERFLKII